MAGQGMRRADPILHELQFPPGALQRGTGREILREAASGQAVELEGAAVFLGRGTPPDDKS